MFITFLFKKYYLLYFEHVADPISVMVNVDIDLNLVNVGRTFAIGKWGDSDQIRNPIYNVKQWVAWVTLRTQRIA